MGDKSKLTNAMAVMRERGGSRYPIADADKLGLTEYFKKNPDVAGMAWGGGLNGSSKEEPRSVVVNPFNKNMKDETKRKGLVELEGARHYMEESKYAPNFEITEKQQQWRKSLGKYADDDTAFRKSIVSRILVNDEVPEATEQQRKEAAAIRKRMVR